jgi:hypothetical protein
MMRLAEWIIGTALAYLIGMAAVWFVLADFWMPLSTFGDRFWLVLCGAAMFGLMHDPEVKK